MASWQDLDRARVAEPEVDAFTECCVLTFSSGPGAKLLEMFRAMTIEKVLPDGASENALRSLEAQRQFVRRIETAVARGIKPSGPSKA
jgi:hypothetical protein